MNTKTFSTGDNVRIDGTDYRMGRFWNQPERSDDRRRYQ